MEKSIDTDKKNAEFLVELHKNVEMAKLALEILIPRTKNRALKADLLNQYHDFEKLSNAISGGLIELGYTPTTPTCRQVFMLKSAIKMSTILNRSPKKLADMVIQGDNKGIMDINRLINQCTFATDKSHNLARLVLETEQSHIDTLKKYL